MTPTKFAERAATRTASPGEAFDPSIILIIAELIIPIIEAIQGCIDDIDEETVVTNPNRRQRLYVYLRARNELRGTGKGWQKEARKVAKAIIDEAATLTSKEIKELLET